MKQGSRSLRCFVKTYPVFALFITSYTLVHVVFEYSFWFTFGDAIFGKSAEPTEGNALLSPQ